MAGDQLPGVSGLQPRRHPDAGTLAPVRSPSPGIRGADRDGLGDLETALAQLKVETTSFAYRFIADGKARNSYIARTVAASEHYRQQVSAGLLSAESAAREVNHVRNEIMVAVRRVTSDIGEAYAQRLKGQGKTLAELEQRYAQRLFGQPFDALPKSRRDRVWLEIVEAAGRPQDGATRTAKMLGRIGQRLVFLTTAFAVYNVATAEDKPRQAVKEIGTSSAGILGAAAGGAAAGLLCGPGAPLCVAAGVFVGGAAAALGFEFAFDARW